MEWVKKSSEMSWKMGVVILQNAWILLEQSAQRAASLCKMMVKFDPMDKEATLCSHLQGCFRRWLVLCGCADH